jgi:hypothetical protein
MSNVAFPPLNQQTVTIFSAGFICCAVLLYLPSILYPSPLFIARSLSILYTLSTSGLAFALWFHRKSLPPPSSALSVPSFTSIPPNHPLRYSYFFLVGTITLLQLLFPLDMTRHVWACILLFIGHCLSHLPFILYAFTTVAAHYRVKLWSPYFFLLFFPLLLILTAAGAIFTISEYALSRPDASLAWYALREVLELAYLMMMVMPVVDVKGVKVERYLAGYLGRMALWAMWAYSCRLEVRGRAGK